MIGALKGVVTGIGEDCALIEVGGVGYLVQAGSRTLARLALNQGAALSIETQVREDAIRLFAFLTEQERGWFQHLQSVQGVGAKVALAILDALGADGVADALALGDKAAFSRANGVGPKLAARIAQELAGKQAPKTLFGGSGGPTPERAGGAEIAVGAMPQAVRAEVVSALTNLGIDASAAARAAAAAARALGPGATLQDLIRASLKEASGG